MRESRPLCRRGGRSPGVTAKEKPPVSSCRAYRLAAKPVIFRYTQTSGIQKSAIPFQKPRQKAFHAVSSFISASARLIPIGAFHEKPVNSFHCLDDHVVRLLRTCRAPQRLAPPHHVDGGDLPLGVAVRANYGVGFHRKRARTSRAKATRWRRNNSTNFSHVELLHVSGLDCQCIGKRVCV